MYRDIYLCPHLASSRRVSSSTHLPGASPAYRRVKLPRWSRASLGAIQGEGICADESWRTALSIQSSGEMDNDGAAHQARHIFFSSQVARYCMYIRMSRENALSCRWVANSCPAGFGRNSINPPVGTPAMGVNISNLAGDMANCSACPFAIAHSRMYYVVHAVDTFPPSRTPFSLSSLVNRLLGERAAELNLAACSPPPVATACHSPIIHMSHMFRPF